MGRGEGAGGGKWQVKEVQEKGKGNGMDKEHAQPRGSGIEHRIEGRGMDRGRTTESKKREQRYMTNNSKQEEDVRQRARREDVGQGQGT